MSTENLTPLPPAQFLAAELRATRALLFKILNEYSFTWHYSMEKTGYVCSFCNALIRNSGDLGKPEHHKTDCAFMLAQQLRGTRPYLDGQPAAIRLLHPEEPPTQPER